MNAQDRQRLEALYRALPGDEPLEPGDPRYFPIYDDPKLTSEDPVEQLARGIEWSERGNVQFLVGSHRCGKSTELRRLKARLEAAGRLVGLVDARQLRTLYTQPIPAWMAFLVARGAWTRAEEELREDVRDRELRLLEESLAKLGKSVFIFEGWKKSSNFKDLFQTLATELGFDPLAHINVAVMIDNFDQDIIRDVLLASLQRLGQLLTSEQHAKRKLIVLVDSLEHVYNGSFLHLKNDWPKFDLTGIYQVISLGPAAAQGHNAYPYVGDRVRWIEPLDVHSAGISDVVGALGRYLDERSTTWRILWDASAFKEVVRTSAGSLGELFRFIRESCQDTRVVPINGQVARVFAARWAADELEYFEDSDYDLLSGLLATRRFTLLVRSAAISETEDEADLDKIGELSERLNDLFTRGVILYRRDRGFFLHPALAPEVEKRLRAQRASSLQLPAPVPIDECLHFKQLRIRNLRVFDNFQLELRPPESAENGHWLLFLGDNGVGKTTLLRSIVLALADRDAANALFQLLGPAAPFLSHGATEGSVEVRVDGRTYRAELERDARDVERIADSRDGAPLPVFAYGCQRGTALGGPRREVEFRPLDDVRTLFEPNAHLIHAESWLASLKLAALQDAGGAAEAFFEAVRQTLVACLDGVEKLEVIKDGEAWLEGPSIGKARLAGLSDGYITTAGWILDWMARWADRSRRLGIALDGDFRERMYGLVLIDEIDLHLHPRWQVEIVPTVRRLFPRTSFVATTHNPLTLLGAEPGEIHVLRRGEDRRVEAIQRDIPAGTRADQVLTGEWFGLPSTLDRETLELLDQHRELLRQQVAREDPERQSIEDELRLRLGTFADTSIERMVQSVAAELTPPIETLEKLGPKAREELRERILAQAHKRRDGG